jgi:hypothetical protein
MVLHPDDEVCRVRQLDPRALLQKRLLQPLALVLSCT